MQSENKEDAYKIRKLLLELDENEAKRTRKDIEIRGQWNCGIITDDGYLIDGNRRMSIISKLYEDTGLEKWKYINVARLEQAISAEELWALEAGIQLGKNEIVRYGPINELLKLREGKKTGLSEDEIINRLYGYEEKNEIVEKLDRLELIEEYLRFIGTPKKYSKIKNRVEHFINLQNILLECDQQDYDLEKILKIKHAVFQLIKEEIPHLELRKIKQMIEKNLDDAIFEIYTAGKTIKPSELQKPTLEEVIEEDTGDIMNEFTEKDKELSPTFTHFINARDFLDVSNNEGKEILLLNRAEKNLKPLSDYQGSELFTPEAISIIKKIASHVKKLTERLPESDKIA